MGNIINYFGVTKEYFEMKIADYTVCKEILLKGLQESVNYSLYSGGKRIRPMFVFIVGELFEMSKERMISLACAVEMIHTASLIMDDLPHMDGAKMRRGRPANHVVYGQDVAALASIGLLNRAYEVVLNDPLLPDDKKTKVVSHLANAVGIDGMAGGQFVDLKFSRPEMEYATLEFIHNYKTASLFVASGVSSAIIGDATGRQIEAVEQYARCLGFAFQIMDDLADATEGEEISGKDMKKDKGNFVKLFGEERSKELAREYAQKAGDALSIFAGKEEKLIFLKDLILLKAKKGSENA